MIIYQTIKLITMIKKTLMTSIPCLFILFSAAFFNGSIFPTEDNSFVPESCKVRLCTSPAASGHEIRVMNSSGAIVATCVTLADGCCGSDANFRCDETHYAYDYTLDCYFPVGFIPGDMSGNPPILYVSSTCP